MKGLLFAAWFFLLITGIEPVVGQSVISKGSIWKYLDDGSDQGTAWREAGFNDSTWKSGPAILGYGNINAGAIATTLSYGDNSSNKYTTTYLRSTFPYTASLEETGLVFDVLVDDGAVIYINGSEVLRVNMPTGDVHFNTNASGVGNENSYQRLIVPIEDVAGVLSDSNIIAVELHQVSASSSDIGWDIELSSSFEKIIYNPKIRFGSTGDPLNGLTITWSGRGTSDSIEWGYTGNFEKGKFEGLKRQNTFGATVFDFAFPTLLADSTLHYSIYDSKDSTWTEEKIFKTASAPSDNQFSFTVLGDSRSYPHEWQIISEATLETDFTLFMGDIINDGAVRTDWDAWFEFGEKFISREPIYHCIGNHDEDNSPSGFDTYKSLFTLPGEETYYSFNYGNTVFICLNTEDSNNPAQYNWLLSKLEEYKDQTWKIVFFHRPFYTSPSHVGEMDAYFSSIWKAFDDYGVDMIFNGHTHNYQRTKPINRNISTTSPVANYGSVEGMGRCQIVAGNAGAPLNAPASADLWWLERTESKRHFCDIDVDGDLLTFKAMDANHVVFDEFVLDKSTVGTNDVSHIASIVYPNPSNGEFYIEMQTGEKFSYRIFNSMGQLILDSQNSQSGDSRVRVDLTNNPRGIYFIELRSEQQITIEKIIIN